VAISLEGFHDEAETDSTARVTRALLPRTTTLQNLGCAL
jgi:hypothetical protein